MAHFLLVYHVAPDYLARRPLFRAAHLELARAAVARGELVLGGALEIPAGQGSGTGTDAAGDAGPAGGAALLFRAAGPQTAADFARADPYVLNGLVARWEVLRWKTVVGALAADPVA